MIGNALVVESEAILFVASSPGSAMVLRQHVLPFPKWNLDETDADCGTIITTTFVTANEYQLLIILHSKTRMSCDGSTVALAVFDIHEESISHRSSLALPTDVKLTLQHDNKSLHRSKFRFTPSKENQSELAFVYENEGHFMIFVFEMMGDNELVLRRTLTFVGMLLKLFSIFAT